MAPILAFIRKDLLLELRQGYALGGLVVFVLCIAFVIYVSLVEITGIQWVAFYWIAFLFISIHTVLKGFAMEGNNRYLYYYSLLRPEHIFIAKWVYNTLMLAGLGLLMFAALGLIAGNPIQEFGLFFVTILCGAIGISLCFTFVSAIALKSEQNTTLMTILSFPLIIPELLHLIRMSKAALSSQAELEITSSLITLGAIDLLLVGLGLLLFPYLWRS